MDRQDKKYLRMVDGYDQPENKEIDKGKGEGLDGKIRDLSSLWGKALTLKRIPVITNQPPNTNRHNFGKPLNNFTWPKYLDLDKTEAYKLNEDGTIKREPFPLHYVLDSDLNIKSYSQNQIHTVPLEKLYDRDNEKYKLLLVAPSIGPPTPPYYIRFIASQAVNDLTDSVLTRLGTSRVAMQDAQELLCSRCSTKNLFEKIKDEKFFYSCLHIRANDALFVDYRFFHAALPSNIKKLVYRACPRGTKLYIMSDIHDAKYFDFLRNRYDVYTYHDFPELKNLVHKDSHFADNHLLFMVEKNIMDHALVKLAAHRRSLYHFQSDFTYHTPQTIRDIFEYTQCHSEGDVMKAYAMMTNHKGIKMANHTRIKMRLLQYKRLIKKVWELYT